MKQALNLPKKIYFKTGSAPVALRELSDIYHCNRALLITDPKLYLAGVAAPVVDQLRHQEFGWQSTSPLVRRSLMKTSGVHCLS